MDVIGVLAMSAFVLNLSRVDLICISAFLIGGTSTILALRHFKQFLIGCISLPIAALCGVSAHFIMRWSMGQTAGILYGLGSFAISGLLLIAILRWIISLDAY